MDWGTIRHFQWVHLTTEWYSVSASTWVCHFNQYMNRCSMEFSYLLRLPRLRRDLPCKGPLLVPAIAIFRIAWTYQEHWRPRRSKHPPWFRFREGSASWSRIFHTKMLQYAKVNRLKQECWSRMENASITLSTTLQSLIPGPWTWDSQLVSCLH